MVKTWAEIFPLSHDLAKKLRRVRRLFQEGRTPRRELEECQLLASDLGEKIACRFLAGDGFLFQSQWHNAVTAYKCAIKEARTISFFDLERKETLRILAFSFFLAIFFLLEEDRAISLARKLSGKEPYGIEFLLGLIAFCPRGKAWERLVLLCDLVERRAITREGRAHAFMEKGCALLALGRLRQAKLPFYGVMRLLPRHPGAYEYVGGIYLREGNIHKASYFLRSAHQLGGTAIGFLTDLFVEQVLSKDYQAAGQTLGPMSNDEQNAFMLFEALLLSLTPELFQVLLQSFNLFCARLREQKNIPRKTLRFLERLQATTLRARNKSEELRNVYIPLAGIYWGCAAEFQALSYHDCMGKIQERSAKESEDFFAAYGVAIADRQEYEDFIANLKERGVPYGLTLLTISQFIDAFHKVFSEMGRDFDCEIRFDPAQKDTCLYQRGRIMFGGVSLLYFENEEEIERKIHSALLEVEEE